MRPRDWFRKHLAPIVPQERLRPVLLEIPDAQSVRQDALSEAETIFLDWLQESPRPKLQHYVHEHGTETTFDLHDAASFADNLSPQEVNAVNQGLINHRNPVQGIKDLAREAFKEIVAKHVAKLHDTWKALPKAKRKVFVVCTRYERHQTADPFVQSLKAHNYDPKHAGPFKDFLQEKNLDGHQDL